MDTLVLDLYLPIMALLPTFECRWSLGHVSKEWHATYKRLLDPRNDEMASEHLKFMYTGTGHGPRCTSWPFRGGTTWIYDFVHGDYCMGEFHLSSAVRIHIIGDLNVELFQIASVLGSEGPCWKLFWSMVGLRRKDREAIIPHRPGDIFDQVAHARELFSADFKLSPNSRVHPTPEAWRAWTSFDPALARRIYNFPYFVRLRETQSPLSFPSYFLS